MSKFDKGQRVVAITGGAGIVRGKRYTVETANYFDVSLVGLAGRYSPRMFRAWDKPSDQQAIQAGDYVTCVDASNTAGHLNDGTVYFVTNVNHGNMLALDGVVGGWRSDRFAKCHKKAAKVPTTGYPDSNPKTAVGLTKPQFSVIPPTGLIELGRVMKDGKEKYGLMNWREHEVSASVYFDAAMRHMLAWWDGEDNARDSGAKHLAHAMACFAIVLDAEANGKLNDDRPIKGKTADLIEMYTKKAA